MRHITYETEYIDVPVVLCLGTFDGLHIGHQKLIQKGKEIANKQGFKTAVYSFENIPSSYLFHETEKKNLFNHQEKVESFLNLDIEYLWLDFFDSHIASVSPKEYILYLKKVLNVKHVVVGFNYTFGDKAKGKPEDLEKFGDEFGFGVTVIDPVMLEDETVSSTAIRKYLNDGDITKVSDMLGRPFSVSGVVVHGKKMGSKMGFPTINLLQEERKILPKCGVYATNTKVEGKEYNSITNIGVRPTFFDNGELTVETHILDFSENCYGRHVTIEFLKFISDEIKLADRAGLKKKIDNDVKMVREFFMEG